MAFNGGFGITHYWYKDNEKVAEGWSYTITSAQVGHSGVYECRTKSKNSAQFRLDVSDGPVILQAPPLVYRGSDVVLRCHSRPGYRVISTTFYKDGNAAQPSTNDLATVTIPQNQQVGRYRCTRTLSWEEYVTYTDEVSPHIRGRPSKEDRRNPEGNIPKNHTTPNKPEEEDRNQEGGIPKDYTIPNIIRLVWSGFIVIGLIIILHWHIKM
ncbi:Fc receptor-like protein 5 [Lithobates pipiens]